MTATKMSTEGADVLGLAASAPGKYAYIMRPEGPHDVAFTRSFGAQYVFSNISGLKPRAKDVIPVRGLHDKIQASMISPAQSIVDACEIHEWVNAESHFIIEQSTTLDNWH